MRKVLLIILLVIVLVGLGLVGYFYVAPWLNSENRRIDRWISANNLNEYGDPQNTAYSNDAPCDTALACYDYIKKMHPDKPWDK